MNFQFRQPDSIVDDEPTSRILLTITIEELELGSSASSNVEVTLKWIITLVIFSRYSSRFLRVQLTLASRVGAVLLILFVISCQSLSSHFVNLSKH